MTAFPVLSKKILKLLHFHCIKTRGKTILRLFFEKLTTNLEIFQNLSNQI